MRKDQKDIIRDLMIFKRTLREAFGFEKTSLMQEKLDAIADKVQALTEN